MKFINIKTPIKVCDIGASPVDKTDFIEELINNTDSVLIGFEPNYEEFQKLNQSDPKKKYYNFGIGDGSEKILNICKAAGMSSFLEPDLEYLNNFHGFDQWSQIIKQVKVKTKKLNDIDENIDFLKIDIQGYESEVIKNGIKKIKDCLVVQIETSPTPLYKNEETFSSVILQLEKLGFCLHMFNNINTKSFKPTLISNNPRVGLHHLFQLDCVLVKNLNVIESYNLEELKKLILIMFHSFKSYDLVDYLIRILDRKTNEKNIEQFRSILSKIRIQKKY